MLSSASSAAFIETGDCVRDRGRTSSPRRASVGGALAIKEQTLRTDRRCYLLLYLYLKQKTANGQSSESTSRHLLTLSYV